MLEELNRFKTNLEVEGRDPKTIDTYMNYVRKFEEHHVGKSVNEITIDDVNNFLFTFRDKGDATMNKVKASLRKYLSFYDKDNLVKKIKLKKLKIKIREIPTQNEIKEFIKKIPENNLRNLREKTMIIVLYCTGLRVNELANIKKSNFYSNKNEVFVPKEIAKMDQERTIVLVENTVFEYLNKYWKRRRDKSEFAFVKKNGIFFSIKTIEHIINKWWIKSGIEKKLTPQVLRICYNSHNKENGVPEEIRLRNMGHTKEINMIHYTYQELKKVKENLKGSLMSDLNEGK